MYSTGSFSYVMKNHAGMLELWRAPNPSTHPWIHHPSQTGEPPAFPAADPPDECHWPETRRFPRGKPPDPEPSDLWRSPGRKHSPLRRTWWGTETSWQTLGLVPSPSTETPDRRRLPSICVVFDSPQYFHWETQQDCRDACVCAW